MQVPAVGAPATYPVVIAARRRCNQCRGYFLSDTMIRVGSVWVCSSECKHEKLNQTNKRARKRDSDRKSQIDKGPIRDAVKERDGNYCLLCRKAPPLHLHRVRYGSEGGRYEVDNCVFLCNHHHLNTVHANKKVWQPLLLAHLRGEKGARVALVRQLHTEYTSSATSSSASAVRKDSSSDT